MEPGGAASLPAPVGGKWRRTFGGQLSPAGLLVSAAPAAHLPQLLLTSDNEPSQRHHAETRGSVNPGQRNGPNKSRGELG